MLWRRRGERGDKGCSQPRLDIADHVGQRRRVKVLAREVLQVQLPAVHPRRLACPLDALVHKLPDAARTSPLSASSERWEGSCRTHYSVSEAEEVSLDSLRPPKPARTTRMPRLCISQPICVMFSPAAATSGQPAAWGGGPGGGRADR